MVPSLQIETNLNHRSGDLAHARRMFRAEAAFPIKQNKKKLKRGGHFCNERVKVHCLIMDQRELLLNILLKTA